MDELLRSAEDRERRAKPRRFDREVHGILLLDKSVGITSNAALQDVRTLFRALKAGHTGSLDPMASGMLPICFGEATKVCGFLLDSRKSYRFTAKLGEQTDTGDADGTVIERRPIPPLTDAQISTTLKGMIGEQSQVPPMYSALKHQGERLYKLARRGTVIERVARTIFVGSLRLLAYTNNTLEIEVHCSKGTYIRVLANDIAQHFGTVAHLTALRRLGVDPFDSARMYSLEQLRRIGDAGLSAIDGLLIPSDRALPHLQAVHVDAFGTRALLQGQIAEGLESVTANARVRIYGPDGTFLGLGHALGARRIQPRRLFRNSAINP